MSFFSNETSSYYYGDMAFVEDNQPYYAFVFFNVILMVFGIPGNTLVLYVVIRNGAMKTVTNLYLVNLSLADLVFLSLVVPGNIMLELNLPMHRNMCKIFYYILRVTLAASILTLVSMAADRFYGVMYPMKCRIYRTLKSSCIILACVWVVAFSTQIPAVIYVTSLEINDGWTMCIEIWPTPNAKAIYNITFFVFFYVVPLLIIGGCYGRMAKLLWHSFSPQYGDTEVVAAQVFMRRKIAIMILIVVICFASCWFTFHFHEVFVMSLGYFSDASFEHRIRLAKAGQLLGAMNSVLNPFLYAFLSENFRRCFYRAFPFLSKLNLGSSSFVQKDPDEKTMYTRKSTMGKYYSHTRLSSVRSVRIEPGSAKPQPI